MSSNVYSFDNVPDTAKPFYEQSPGAVFQNWVQGQGLSNADMSLAEQQYNSFYAPYLYNVATDPNSSGYFGDYLKTQSLKNYLASFTPQQRGVDTRRFGTQPRWISF